MITWNQRKTILMLNRFKLLKIEYSMRLPWLKGRFGTQFIIDKILREQPVDNLRHAPGCPANHYHRRRVVLDKCQCGASDLA